jgi:Zn finger protein HypA/HybF involved in hydrogenase expression
VHELAAVEALIEAVTRSLAEQRPARVLEVRLRRGSSLAEPALIQGFAALSRGTPLEGARLKVETVDQRVDCPCGCSRQVSDDNLLGHTYVCPDCGAAHPLAGGDDLELVSVTLGEGD